MLASRAAEGRPAEGLVLLRQAKRATPQSSQHDFDLRRVRRHVATPWPAWAAMKSAGHLGQPLCQPSGPQTRQPTHTAACRERLGRLLLDMGGRTPARSYNASSMKPPVRPPGATWPRSGWPPAWLAQATFGLPTSTAVALATWDQLTRLPRRAHAGLRWRDASSCAGKAGRCGRGQATSGSGAGSGTPHRRRRPTVRGRWVRRDVNAECAFGRNPSVWCRLGVANAPPLHLPVGMRCCAPPGLKSVIRAADIGGPQSCAGRGTQPSRPNGMNISVASYGLSAPRLAAPPSRSSRWEGCCVGAS